MTASPVLPAAEVTRILGLVVIVSLFGDGRATPQLQLPFRIQTRGVGGGYFFLPSNSRTEAELEAFYAHR